MNLYPVSVVARALSKVLLIHLLFRLVVVRIHFERLDLLHNCVMFLVHYLKN